MTQFRVINRTTREEQVFNSREFQRFFHCEYDKQTEKIKYNNNLSDYAVSEVKSQKNKLLNAIVISAGAVAIIVCVTKIIMKWS
jgi:hypothetical protein|tara:strand:+ start:457 stop:708 length:252 start_codon:yes stop_codon:yes gene_type:complete